MRAVRTLGDLHGATASARLRAGGTLALVPTMGALHEGHIDLIRAARAAHGIVAASVFVNPTQFENVADLARYPRDEARDLAMLEAAGCDIAWLPDASVMYPPGDATVIEVAGPSLGFEGAARPGHFRGVATVVAKLFGQVRPDAALFGEKDWQQLQVIRRMVADLGLPVAIEGVATRREADGLAMSSRNRFLDAGERRVAPMLYATLAAGAAALQDFEGGSVGRVLASASASLASAGFDVEYFALVDGATLSPLTVPAQNARLLAAARVGTVRLLDNIGVAARETAPAANL